MCYVFLYNSSEKSVISFKPLACRNFYFANFSTSIKALDSHTLHLFISAFTQGLYIPTLK